MSKISVVNTKLDGYLHLTRKLLQFLRLSEMMSPIISIFSGKQVGKATVDLLFCFIFTLQISCEFLSLINSKPKPCTKGDSGKHNSVLEEKIVALAPSLFNVVKYKRKMTKETGYKLLLLLLSRFSCVRLCDSIDGSPPGSSVPRILQARHWSGLPFPSPMHACMHAKLLQSCPTVWPHGQQPTRLLCPQDSPGKNTGVGCHFLLQDIN